MSAGFTKGPWEACDPGDYGDFDGNSRVVLGDDMRIAVVHWSTGDYCAENDANARLIASAPDLYAALDAVVIGLGATETNDGHKDLWRTVFDALAKARGDAS